MYGPASNTDKDPFELSVTSEPSVCVYGGSKDALINKTLIFGPNYACDFSVKWGRKNVAWTNVIMTFDSCLFIDDDPRKLFPFFLKIMRSFSLNAKAAD